MQITRGLIIRDPWIGYILDGTKTWEMRSSGTSVRGTFALIRAGSCAVYGVATLIDVGRPMTPSELLASTKKHRIPPERILSGTVAKWNVPWILSNVRKLKEPVAYDHRSGAVIWVNLDESVTAAISAQLDEEPEIRKQPVSLAKTVEATVPAVPRSSGSLIAQTRLTEANIKNKHFYLRGRLNGFPSDLIGGPNKTERAKKEALIDWGGPTPAVTDIDGKKELFRGRRWVGEFFKLTRANPGDWVVVEQTAPYRYRVSLRKA